VIKVTTTSTARFPVCIEKRLIMTDSYPAYSRIYHIAGSYQNMAITAYSTVNKEGHI